MAARTITRSEFQNAAGEATYVSHVHYLSRAEQIAGDAACQAVVAPAAFIPALSAGPAFDSPEVVKPPNCDFGSYIAQAAHDAAEGPEGCDSTGCVVPQAVDEH